MRRGWRQTSLKSRGTKHNGVFADEYFVLDAEAVRVLGELRIGQDLRQNAADVNQQFTHMLDSDDHPPFRDMLLSVLDSCEFMDPQIARGKRGIN